jgi:hypothetical protein
VRDLDNFYLYLTMIHDMHILAAGALHQTRTRGRNIRLKAMPKSFYSTKDGKVTVS